MYMVFAWPLREWRRSPSEGLAARTGERNTRGVSGGQIKKHQEDGDLLKPQLVQALPNVENFLRHCQRKDYKAKSSILKQGDVADSLYLILDGSVSVQVEDESDPGHMLVVAYLNPGDFVGEMGLFDEEPQARSAMDRLANQAAEEAGPETYERQGAITWLTKAKHRSRKSWNRSKK